MSYTLTPRHRSPPLLISASAVLAALLVSVGAGAAALKPDVVITVFAEHYVLESRMFDDLDLLEGVVGAMRPQAVRVEACGAKADRAQRAAAHRFRNLNLELRILEPHSPACRASAKSLQIPVSARHGTRPFGIDDEAIDRWWHASML